MTEQPGFAPPSLPDHNPTLPPPTVAPPAPPPTPLAAAPEAPLVPPGIPTLPSPSLPDPATPSAASPNPFEHVGVPLIDPDAEHTTPSWKKKKSKARTAVKTLVTLGVLGGLGYGGYLAYQEFAPEPEQAELPLDDPDTLIGQANELTDQINDNSEELEALEQLGIEPPPVDGGVVDPVVEPVGEPLIPPPPAPPAPNEPDGSPLTAQSYEISWMFATGEHSRLLVDVPTQNFIVVTDGAEIRRVGDTTYTFQPDVGWTTQDLPIDLATMVGLQGIPTLADVVPAEAAPYASGTSLDSNDFGTYVIDDVAFFDRNPSAREAWSLRWGSGDMTQPDRDAATSVVFPTVGGPGDIVIHVEGREDGVVSTATVTAVALGGTVEYELVTWSAESNPVTAPELD